MIPLILFIFVVAFTISIYFKNKLSDRSRHRRDRLREKQEELFESLRNKDREKNDDEN